MKRIQSLDILRGIGMLGLVFMHVFEQVGWINITTMFEKEWYVWLPLGLFMYFASWKGVFLLISGVANAYGFQKAIENGKSPHKVLIQRLLWAIVLFFQGVLIQVFFNPWIGLYNVFRTKFLGNTGLVLWDISGLQWSDAVETIAVSIFISTIIQYLLTLGKKKSKSWVAIGVFLILTVTVFVLTPYTITKIIDFFGWTSVTAIKSAAINNFGDRIRWLSLAIFIGHQMPLMPYLAIFFLGTGIGIALTNPKISKKPTLIVGYSLGMLFVVVAILLAAIKHDFSVGFGIIPNTWFLLLATGIQVWALTTFLWVFDFAKKAQRRTKYTKIFRKAGLLSLTIFSLQSLDFFPRWILTVIYASFGQEINFTGHNVNLGLGHTFLISIIVLLYWIGIILLWGLVNFTLSFDWLFEILRRLSSGQKINWKDPMRSREIIKKAEIVFQRSEELSEIG